MTDPSDSASAHSSAPAPWLADREVLVHIGVHKTGTTAVQGALSAARADLAAQGIRYPGTGTDHFVATNAFLGKRRGAGWSTPMDAPSITAWTRLLKEVHDADDMRVVVSSESLCEATPEQIRMFVDEFRGRPLRVVVTLRPLEALMPSTWQQYLKTAHTFTFDEWLTATLSDPIEPRKPTPSFWTRNDHPAVLQRWIDVVGRDRVAAVVVDPRVRTMLFETFEDLIGITRGTLTAGTATLSNRGLSAEEAEFIRQFNASLDRRLDFRHYHLLVRRSGLLDMVEKRSPGTDEHTITMPTWAIERAREIGRRHVDTIRSMGVTVFGDLEDLVPTGPVEGADVVTPTMVPIDAAVTLLRGTLERSIATIEKLEGVSPTTSASAVSSRASGLRAWLPPAVVPWFKAARRRAFMLRRRLRR